MSREIKFRFWGVALKPPQFIDLNQWQTNRVAQEALFGSFGMFNNDLVISQQFTGILDKNGVEIYEGDILSIHRIKHRKYENAEVIWAKEYLTFLAKSYNFNKTDWWSDYLYKLDTQDIEVIGNIFTTPNLSTNK